VAVIVVEALLRVGKRALKGRLQRLMAALAFVALFALGLPFPLIVLAAGLAGAVLLAGKAPTSFLPPAAGNGHLVPVLATGLGLWAAPLLGLWAMGQTFLLTLGLFFSKLALVTFGGAYAVLAYMTQTVVQDQGWLDTAQMIDALGLAETTPGPLILVTEFVAFLAGQAQGGTGLALAATALTLWVTFLPCFLWIFAFAPYIERIAARPRLQGALAGITAAVVGVIASLALWFALHVLFAGIDSLTLGPVNLPLPQILSLDPRAAALMGLSFYLLLMRHWPLLSVLGLSALLGVLSLWVA
ncbi:MAG: chromate transporter, partial [Rhodobacteraceae bacterium]|nr:chromate transporter [Paracoccaceae bacterium]